MKRHTSAGIALLVMGFGFAGLAAAAPEQAGTTAPAPAATTSMTSMTVEGTIASVDLASAAPHLSIKSASGNVLTLAVDPKALYVWKSGRAEAVEQLKAGEQAKVRYIVKDGKQLARSVDITPAASSQTAAAMPSASSGGSN